MLFCTCHCDIKQSALLFQFFRCLSFWRRAYPFHTINDEYMFPFQSFYLITVWLLIWSYVFFKISRIHRFFSVFVLIIYSRIFFLWCLLFHFRRRYRIFFYAILFIFLFRYCNSVRFLFPAILILWFFWVFFNLCLFRFIRL